MSTGDTPGDMAKPSAAEEDLRESVSDARLLYKSPYLKEVVWTLPAACQIQACHGPFEGSAGGDQETIDRKGAAAEIVGISG
jgi:hypothetical protein